MEGEGEKGGLFYWRFWEEMIIQVKFQGLGDFFISSQIKGLLIRFSNSLKEYSFNGKKPSV